MNAKIASLAVGLLIAGTPAFAQQSKPAKPAAAKATATPHPKLGRDKAAMPAALMVMPEAQRLAIQADLTWLGYFDGMSAEEVDGHTADAIKAFQRRNSGKETGSLSEQERVLLVEAAKPRQTRLGWRLIDDSATGARIGIPEKFVPRVSTARIGSRWASAGGQIQIETFRLHEASLPALFEQERKTSQRRIAYSVLNPESFVIIGEQRLKKLVVRAQSKDSEVRGVTVLYDQATEGTMAPVAVALADTFIGFPDSNTAVAAGHKRGVEYSTAIVVTTDGDLIALDEATNECQSLMVPGFGHADRIVEDQKSGLALLRLYGAHNLITAPLSGDAATSANLMLFGIADPLAQNDGTVTKAAAQITPQGVVPAPPPGFAGAPAIDAQGRFAGIIALQAPVVAGGSSVPLQASLVPAATVRAFLTAQGIVPGTPDAGHVAMDQSVVRLICVRK
jgi:peptidoglycan hydrolase-like protein with peptidoglycan-binding domain